MELGAFSVSLNVKDIKVSKEFYEKLGFAMVGGDVAQNWAIMRCGDHTIGLFQGMFEKNAMTFNPGWDQHCNKLESFTDIRELQKKFKSAGVELKDEVKEGTSGPGHFSLVDPDGNPILFDQHV